MSIFHPYLPTKLPLSDLITEVKAVKNTLVQLTFTKQRQNRTRLLHAYFLIYTFTLQSSIENSIRTQIQTKLQQIDILEIVFTNI